MTDKGDEQSALAHGLQVQHISKSFKKRKVVDRISLHLQQNQAIGLLGPNGAGKTTSFYMIMGLIRPDSGRIFLNDMDVTSLPMYRRARLGLGYLPQEASIFKDLTVEENILSILQTVYPEREHQYARLYELLDEFSVSHLRDIYGGALSGGERRRVEIARTLASNPQYILLDEPFAGVDPIAVGDIRALIAQLTDKNIGVLITDHNVRETLGTVDAAVIIHDGRILMQGTPDEIIGNEEVKRYYLGDEFTL